MMGPEAATALAVLVVLAVVVAGAETLLLNVSRARAATWNDESTPGAATLVELLQRRQTHAALITVVRVVLEVVTLGLVATSVDDGRWPALAATGAVLGVGEAVARTVALARGQRVVRRSMLVVRSAAAVPGLVPVFEALTGLVRGQGSEVSEADVRPTISEEELLAFAEVAVEAEAIEEEEHALIQSIIAFGDTIVREVMVPRPDMISVEASWRVSDVIEVVILNGLSRLPVVGDSIDDVIGLAYAKDLMRAERDGRGASAVSEHLRSAHFVPEQQLVSTLLREMQAEQFHMAVVVDEYGGVAGLVTLEDLIEELVGEIVDEYDVEEPLAEPLPGGAYQVNARMPLDEVNDLLAADLPDGDWDTVGGLLFAEFGRVPTNGEAVDIGPYRLTAARVQGRRIRVVRIDRHRPTEPGVDAEEIAR